MDSGWAEAKRRREGLEGDFWTRLNLRWVSLWTMIWLRNGFGFGRRFVWS